MSEKELYHYGVLGMKWGVRKDRSSKSGSSKSRNKSKNDLQKIKLNKHEKNALKVAGVMSGISAAQTIQNYQKAQQALDAMGFGDRIIVSQVVTKGAVAAGRAACIGVLGYYGAMKVSDYIKTRTNEE